MTYRALELLCHSGIGQLEKSLSSPNSVLKLRLNSFSSIQLNWTASILGCGEVHPRASAEEAHVSDPIRGDSLVCLQAIAGAGLQP